MRNYIVISSAIALAVALVSLVPNAWTHSSIPGGKLSSVSVNDLTLAAGSLETLSYADAH